MTERTYSLMDLAGASGIAARTIRFYIARGLLPPPLMAGRNACYGPHHLIRLEQIKRRQQDGATLAEMASDTQPPAHEPSTSIWEVMDLAADLKVHVAQGMPPWRRRLIRKALQDLCAALSNQQRE